MNGRTRTFGNEEVEQSKHDRMTAKHVIATSTHTLNGHAATLPNLKCLFQLIEPIAVLLLKNHCRFNNKMIKKVFEVIEIDKIVLLLCNLNDVRGRITR